MSTKPLKILYTEGNREYYLGPDNKIVSQQRDLFKEYRRDELLPEVAAELDQVRSINIYPSDSVINSVISFQNECPEKAVNYIRYRYLGTCSYLDVFGHKAESYYREKMHIEQNERMESKIEGMQQQLFDMQKLMMNVAKSVNPTEMKYSYRAG